MSKANSAPKCKLCGHEHWISEGHAFLPVKQDNAKLARFDVPRQTFVSRGERDEEKHQGWEGNLLTVQSNSRPKRATSVQGVPQREHAPVEDEAKEVAVGRYDWAARAKELGLP